MNTKCLLTWAVSVLALVVMTGLIAPAANAQGRGRGRWIDHPGRGPVIAERPVRDISRERIERSRAERVALRAKRGHQLRNGIVFTTPRRAVRGPNLTPGIPRGLAIGHRRHRFAELMPVQRYRRLRDRGYVRRYD